MSRLREQLFETYNAHYQRVNKHRMNQTVPAKVRRGIERTLGPVLAGLAPGARVLDLGCGTGALLWCLKRMGDFELVGVDVSPEQIDVARQWLPTAELVCADGISYLKEHPGAFDAILSTDVIEHLPDDVLLDFMESAYAALRPNGLLCCRTPNAANLTGTYSRYMDLTHIRSFTDSSLRQLYDVGGFEDCRLVPIRSGGFVGEVRSTVEYLAHRFVFLLCGRGLERTFTYNLMMAGYRREHEGRSGRNGAAPVMAASGNGAPAGTRS